MVIFLFLKHFLVFLTLLPAGASTSPDDQTLYKKVGPKVFQVKIAKEASGAKKSYGSGLPIAKEGLIATNYHVVAAALEKSGRGESIFVIVPTQEKGLRPFKARVMAIDVVSDLAILKIDSELSPLKFAANPPEKGERLYSLGLPEDLNLSIVAGHFNGVLEDGVYRRYQMSTPLNSGMSGGPTVNASGEVVGVNVSVLLNSQSISFSIPLEKLQQLRKRVDQNEVTADNVEEILTAQLTQLQEELVSHLLSKGREVQSWEGWKIPAHTGTRTCWRQTSDKEVKHHRFTSKSCRLSGDTYLEKNFHTGHFSIKMTSIENTGLNSLQFFSLLNRYYNRDSSQNESFLRDDRQQAEHLVTAKKCQREFVTNSKGLPFLMTLCLRSFLPYPHLYSLEAKAISYLLGKKSLIMRMLWTPISAENIGKTLSFLIDQVELQSTDNEKAYD